MEQEIDSQNTIDNDPPQGFEPIGGSGAKTRIVLTFTVSNPIDETNRWKAHGIFAPAARAISFIGGRDIVLEGIDFKDIET